MGIILLAFDAFWCWVWAFGRRGLRLPLVFALFPWEFSRLLHPMFLKFVLRVEEPIPHKGGELVSLFKGKGIASECSNSRGILISDAFANKNTFMAAPCITPFI